MIPWKNDVNILIPADIDNDATGMLMVSMTRAGLVAHFIERGEVVDESSRLRVHWSVCPHQNLWHRTMEKTGHRNCFSTRSGPCGKCGGWNPHRYGGPISSPLCDTCLVEAGFEAISVA